MKLADQVTTNSVCNLLLHRCQGLYTAHLVFLIRIFTQHGTDNSAKQGTLQNNHAG
jgi:hypothetical protein